MTAERASSFRLPFGRHKGLTIAEVAEIDPGWIRWFAAEGSARTVQRACAFYAANILDGRPAE
jgi:hypothetical protein